MQEIKIYQEDMTVEAWYEYVRIFGKSNIRTDEDNPDEPYIRVYGDTDVESAIGTVAMKGLKKFQTDRLLDTKEFSTDVATANILEELLELNGYNVPKSNRASMFRKFTTFIDTCEIDQTISISEDGTDEEYFREDALCDMIVFSIGELMKLGQIPEAALLETSKEITSRVGSIVDGKFEKSLTEADKAKWVKANYNNSKKPTC